MLSLNMSWKRETFSCCITILFTQTSTSRLRCELLVQNSKTYGADCTIPMAALFENKSRMCFWKDIMCPTEFQYSICECSWGREKFITLCKMRMCSNYNLQTTRIQNFYQRDGFKLNIQIFLLFVLGVYMLHPHQMKVGSGLRCGGCRAEAEAFCLVQTSALS